MTKQARTLTGNRLRVAIDKAVSPRAKLILLLSIKSGLRAVEIAGLKWGHIDWEAKMLTLKTTKRDKPRLVPIASELEVGLKEYLSEICQEDIAMTDKECPLLPNDKDKSKHMSPNAVAQWLRRYYRRLGWEGYSSHSGRRTFVTRAARRISDAGGSLRDVQALAGHADLKTTERYIDTDEDAQKKVIDLI